MSDTEKDMQETKQEEKPEEVKEEEPTDNSDKEEAEPTEDKPETNDTKPEENKDGAKKQEEEEMEEDEDAESEEEEQKVGLLEQPVVLEEGRKRERKKVERMTFQSPDTEREKVEIKPGKGTALGDIPWIDHRLNKVKAEDIKPLHRILFRRVGTALEVKKNIRRFSGFTFEKGDTEYEKRMQILKAKTFTKPMIAHVCEILDVPRSGNKDEVCERLMDYLMKPEDTGKKIPKKRKSKSKDKGKKGAKGKSKQKKKTKSKSKAKDDDDDDDDDENDEEEEEEKNEEVEVSDDESDEDSDDSDSDSDKEPPKKRKKTVKPKPKQKKEPAKKTPKKRTPKKKKVSDDEVSDISSDSEDDKPIAKSKQKGPPTNDELKEVIKKMLDGADLEEVTMKSVLKNVFSKYPEHDLTDRKEFVKSTVKQIIS